jgi:hypothetical protein
MTTLRIKTTKALMQTLGRLSDGIRITQEHGFTSGKLLAYIYRNQPSGRWGIGRIIDRFYLGHAGWQAVRDRRRRLEQLLEWAIRRQLLTTPKVFVLDVASGQAAYLQQVLAGFPTEQVEALCWDIDPRWLTDGRQTSAELGLDNIRYARSDALVEGSFHQLPKRPNVVVASGFYDWMPDDETIKRSLRLSAGALQEGGYLVFTFLTGHVDLRLANGVFTSFDGQAMRMRPRSVETVHNWARQEGLEIVRTECDPAGYHTVSVGQRTGRSTVPG